MKEMVAGDVTRSLKFFQRVYGPAPVTQFYAAETPYSHGEAFPGLINLSWGTFHQTDADGSDEVFRAHEVAHQWWGNAVTERDWDDVWLSEGFATYFTLLYTEQFDGREAFVRGLRSSRDRILALERKSPDTPVIHRNLSDMRRVLNQFVYQKGGWVLHMLRRLVGDAAFFDGIRRYYREFEHATALTEDLQTAMEAARLGGRILEEWGSKFTSREKGPANLVTEADLASQSAIFELLRRIGSLPLDDYRRTFNLGVGMIVCVSAKDAGRAGRLLNKAGETFFQIGRVIRQPKGTSRRVVYR